MPDICDLILEGHETFRRHFAELDDLRAAGAGRDAFAREWKPVADLLEVHAASEEELFYPRLLPRGDDAEEETRDAIGDHNDIRDAVRRATEREVGSDEWWNAVLDAREQNSDHMAEEERGAIPDFRAHAEGSLREDLGVHWLRFQAEHAEARGIDLADKDPDRYVARHG
ncbi:MAG: hemerythrin domain-containing protein [Acidimicrobiales bacterium]